MDESQNEILACAQSIQQESRILLLKINDITKEEYKKRLNFICNHSEILLKLLKGDEIQK